MRARPTRPTLAALVALVGALALPGVAQAGLVPGGFSPRPPTAGCIGAASCSSYGFSAASTSALLGIKVTRQVARVRDETAYLDLAAPAWPHKGRVSGFQATVDVAKSTLNTGWQVGICRPAAPGFGLCQGPYVAWSGGAAPTQLTIPIADGALRVMLRYRGGPGTPPQLQTQGLFRARWSEIDTQAPTIAFTAAGTGDVVGARDLLLNGATGASLSASASDNVGVGSGAVSIDGAERDVGPGGGSVTVPDGGHTVTARFCDSSSPAVCATQSGKVTVDTGRPVVALDRVTASADPRPVVTATITDPPVDGYASGLRSVRLLAGDRPLDVDQTVSGDRYTLRLRDPLPEGRYPLTLVATDNAGNEGTQNPSAEGPAQLVVDSGAPTAEAVSPAAGAKLRSSPSQIAARLRDAVGVVSAKMLVDGVQVNASFVAPDLTYAPPALCPGPHIVQVSGQDAVGRSADLLWTFSIRGALRGRCARVACTRNKLQAKRFRASAAFALRSERRSRRALRKAKTKSQRLIYRASIAKWRGARADARTALRVVDKNARGACKAARRGPTKKKR